MGEDLPKRSLREELHEAAEEQRDLVARYPFLQTFVSADSPEVRRRIMANTRARQIELGLDMHGHPVSSSEDVI